MAAKYLRCSVLRAMKLPDEDINNAYTAAAANEQFRAYMIEHPKKK